MYFRNQGANFVEICNICANQMVIKVAVSIINSDKLRHGYDDFILESFWGHAVYWHSLDDASMCCWQPRALLLDFDGIYLLTYLISCAACSGADTICPAPWKWWIEQHREFSAYTNRLLEINIPVNTQAVRRRNSPTPSKCLIFQTLNGVTGNPCHGLLPANVQLPTPFHSRLKVRQGTDRQKHTTAINTLCPHTENDINAKARLQEVSNKKL